ncbi:hypothetical protein DFP72DRAFT_913017 [Ephemerocybe angulata]|uniref:Uncharacterized protein n=1 Tax=Ephemerocybe angulata TaxID=980116 RepID=A0A8H6HNA2_9AGAR|nr:hypothetical protein DFP72DRAFT_913017 [Tulosesus angulatus]
MQIPSTLRLSLLAVASTTLIGPCTATLQQRLSDPTGSSIYRYGLPAGFDTQQYAYPPLSMVSIDSCIVSFCLPFITAL